MRSFSRSVGLILAFLLSLSSLSSLRAADLPSGMTGTWEFIPSRSTDLSPWRNATLQLSLEGHTLTIERTLKWGRRNHVESLTVDLAAPSTVNPLAWWVDNRHLGAYAPHGGTQTVSPTVLDDGRVLRLSLDYTLETQQGDRAVNTLRQFQLSPDGRILTVTDLRSTRPRPVIHVFERSGE